MNLEYNMINMNEIEKLFVQLFSEVDVNSSKEEVADFFAKFLVDEYPDINRNFVKDIIKIIIFILGHIK